MSVQPLHTSPSRESVPRRSFLAIDKPTEEISACHRPGSAEDESRVSRAWKGASDVSWQPRSRADRWRAIARATGRERATLAKAARLHEPPSTWRYSRQVSCLRKSASGCSGTRNTGFTPAACWSGPARPRRARNGGRARVRGRKQRVSNRVPHQRAGIPSAVRTHRHELPIESRSSETRSRKQCRLRSESTFCARLENAAGGAGAIARNRV